MGKYFHVNGGILGNNRGEFNATVANVIAQMLLNEGQVTGTLTYKSVDMKSTNDKYFAAIGSRNFSVAKSEKANLRYMHKVIANDVEREINTFNKPELAGLLGFRLKQPPKSQNKPPITVVNDVTPGNIIVDLLKVEGAHEYFIECTLISETGGPNVITTIRTTNCHSYFDGFVVGAKYSFRAQAVLANNTLVNWTPSVILRIN